MAETMSCLTASSASSRWLQASTGPIRVRRWDAGQVDNLDNLFGREGIGRTRAGRVREDGGDGGAEVVLALYQVRWQVEMSQGECSIIGVNGMSHRP